jgi:hypothetical protein
MAGRPHILVDTNWKTVSRTSFDVGCRVRAWCEPTLILNVANSIYVGPNRTSQEEMLRTQISPVLPSFSVQNPFIYGYAAQSFSLDPGRARQSNG